MINDPVNQHLCRCNQPSSINTRSSPFIPFHRRPRITPSNVSDSSKPMKNENPSESIENHDILIESTSSPIVTTNTQSTINEKPIDWIASTPLTAPPSVLAPITNLNSVPTNSPLPNPPSTRGVKRTATVAFDETTSVIDDDEREQHKQTYDFYRTDSL
jgi:hypothetical protein